MTEKQDQYANPRPDDTGWPDQWGTCQREHEPGSPMFTNDASDYFSALRTKAAFHCNAFAPPDLLVRRLIR